MRRILYGASMSVEHLVTTHCQGSRITKQEFRKLVRSLIDKLADFEIDSIFKELDRTNAGSIPRDQFLDLFGRDEQEKLFQTGIEDIIKPLVTFLARKKLTVVDLFNKYDQNKNQMMSAQELQAALKDLLKFEMSPDEVNTMHEFFRAKFKRSEVKKAEFAELLKKETKRFYEAKGAKSALASVKKKLRESGRAIEAVLSQQQAIFPGEVTIRGFKLATYSLGCVTQQQVNNLARYMDRRNNGMILIADVRLALDGDGYNPTTIKK